MNLLKERYLAGQHKAAFTLAEVFSKHRVSQGLAAFTLAEVLITLGIIGVVASLTLPTLISNHQKQVYVTGLKKAINMSQNMLKKMQADEEAASVADTELFANGMCTPSTNNDGSNANGCEDFYGNPSVFERLVPKYLKVVKSCSGSDCDIKYTKSTFTCTSDDRCTYIQSSQAPTTILSVLTNSYTENSVRGFYTADSMVYYMIPTAAPGILFAVDVNGQKGPNVMGRDLFVYQIDGTGKVYTTSYMDASEKMTWHLMSNGWNMDY